MTVPLLWPSWPAPPTVGAAMSLREGGVSGAPWNSLNLGLAVGDDAAAVALNRAQFAGALGARPIWLRQVHGVNVVRLTGSSPDQPEGPADAAWTTEPGVACTVQVADCLPVLIAERDGAAVAAAHVGWRGLAAGVLEATLRSLNQGAGVRPQDVMAWLGPCIGPRQFEVGIDVLSAFGQDPAAPDGDCFVARPRPGGSPRWLANLQLLAMRRLMAAGVGSVSAEPACTALDASRFFSFRRDAITGRHAAAIWRR